MTGTILNSVGIILGAILAVTLRRQPAANTQFALKGILGMLTIFVGLRLTWISLGDNLASFGRQLLIVLLALTLGRLAGQLLHLQKHLNRLGQFAKQKVADATSNPAKQGWSEGFFTGAILYCATPLSVVGALVDGFGDQWHALAIKAVIDGLATMAFMTLFGWSIVMAVIPVIAWQGTIALVARLAVADMAHVPWLDSFNATAGMLIFCVSLIILELKKIELADYLPSLLVAPVLAMLWR